jgi:hypothetical protein
MISNSKQYDDLIDIISTIKKFKETKNTFYRDNEADYYHKILEVIEFFQEIGDDLIEENQDLFMRNYHVMNDFRDLFLELYDDDNYAQSSAKKRNFYHTIDTLLDFVQIFRDTTTSAKITTAVELKKLQSELKKSQEFSQKIYDEYNQKISLAKDELQGVKREFFDTKKAIEEDNRLYATKEYWRKKKDRHKRVSLVLSSIFVVIIITLALSTFYNLSNINRAYLEDINRTKSTKSIKSYIKSPPSKYLIIDMIESLFMLSLMIWMARIVLKIIFSNLHLKEEAYEKETMIATYLALIKEGGGLRESDRSLILESIFRPSTNGLIKDESSVTLLDVVNVFKGK